MRLADWVRAVRMTPVFRSKGQFAADTGLSVNTLQRIESNTPVSPGTYARLNIACNWQPGSAEMILNGSKKEPVSRVSLTIPNGPIEEKLWEVLGTIDGMSMSERWMHLETHRKHREAMMNEQEIV